MRKMRSVVCQCAMVFMMAMLAKGVMAATPQAVIRINQVDPPVLGTNVTYTVTYGAETRFMSPPYTYQWKFRDGSTSSAAAPSRTYQVQIDDRIDLIITGNDGSMVSPTLRLWQEITSGHINVPGAPDGFRNYSQVKQAIRALDDASDHVSTVSLGTSANGTENITAIKISKDGSPTNDPAKPDFFFTGGIHPAEWIGYEVCLQMAIDVARMYGGDPEITAIIDNAELWFVPVINPEGLSYSQNNYYWRGTIEGTNTGPFVLEGRDWYHNRNLAVSISGIQLNRNFGENGGSTGQEESETLAVKSIMNRVNSLRGYIDYHAATQGVYYPQAFPREEAVAAAVARSISEAGVTYASGTIESVCGDIPGDAMEWFSNHQALALAIELRGDLGQPFYLPEGQIRPTVDENLAGWMEFVKTILVAPAQPKKVQTITGDGEVRVTWGAPTKNQDGSNLTDLAGYHVRYSLNLFDDPDAVLMPPVDKDQLECYLNSLDNDTLYFISVTAFDTAGNESEPAMITAMPRDAIWVNDPDSALPGQYTSIQAALSAASEGDTIMVGPGTYPETSLIIGDVTIEYRPLKITLQSERGPAKTIIEGGSASGFLVKTADACRIIGFTIRNVDAAIECFFSNDVLISNNIFISNDTAISVEGVLSNYGKGPVRIYNNVFVGAVSGEGRGISGFNNILPVEVFNNIFQNNEYGLYLYPIFNHFIVDYNSFRDNGEQVYYVWIPNDDSRRIYFGDNNPDCDTGFVRFDPLNPEDGDYHLESDARCTVDSGKVFDFRDEISREEIEWKDCDGSLTDRGAFGGPFAYIDNDQDGIPDCEAVRASNNSVIVLRTAAQPIELSARGPEGIPLTYLVKTPPSHGQLEGVAPFLTYTVDPAYQGQSDSFTFEASTSSSSSEATVGITVMSSDNRPEVNNITVPCLWISPLKITLTATDPDENPLFYVLDSQPSCGLLWGDPPDLVYFPEENCVGVQSFDFHATDTIMDSETATVTIIVDHEPTIDSYYPEQSEVVVGEDGSQLFWVTVSDLDVTAQLQTLTYSWELDGTPVSDESSYVFNPAFDSAAGSPYTLTVAIDDGLLPPVARSWTIVVENTTVMDDAAAVYTGTWTESCSGSGYFGRSFKIHQTGSAGSATWTTSMPAAGKYKLYARWPADASYATAAVYRVFYTAERYDDLVVDQTKDGGRWNLLGTYFLAEGFNAQVKLKFNSGEMGVADAVKWVATDGPADVILDEVGGTASNPPSAWSSVAGGFNGYCLTAPVGTGNKTFTWTPGALTPGTYEVYAWWKVVTGAATNTKYVVNFEGVRNSQITVDQTVNGNRWVNLGTYYFGAVDTPSVVMSDNANGTVVVADAVKFVYLSDNMSSIIDNTDFDYCSWSGNWVTRTNVSGYVGQNFRQVDAGADGSWLKWKLPIAEEGTYEVYTRWTSSAQRAASVRYEVRRWADAIPATVAMDQRIDGGKWRYLGRFNFDTLPEHEKSVTVYRSEGGSVAADAVLYVRTDEDPPITIDNRANSLKFSQTGIGDVPNQLIMGYWGIDYFQTTISGGTATWTPDIATKGNYDISARWTAANNRTTVAKYTVRTDDGDNESVVVKNQRKDGGMWAELGRYYLPEGTSSWVQVESQDTSVTVADAVRFEYTTLPLPIIIDDLDTTDLDRFTVESGTWMTASAPLTGFYPEVSHTGRYYLPHDADPNARVRWTPSINERGYYAVYSWWPLTDETNYTGYATNSPFKIVHALAPAGEIRAMNQQVNGGQWNYLGTFLFDDNEDGYVELSAAANGKVLADAVKFIREGD